MKIKRRPTLLVKILFAILLGILCGFWMPEWLVRIFATFNGLFGNLLNFIIPLLILGLIVPGIAAVGKGAGRLLLLTTLLAYGFTVMSGLFTWGVSMLTFPSMVQDTTLTTISEGSSVFTPYFTVEMPPIMSVMSALVAAFIIGIGLAITQGDALKRVFDDFQKIINLTISKVIIPLLPIYIFGIFLSMTTNGEVVAVLGVFLKLVVVIFAMTAVLLLIQFSIAGLVARRNPLKLLRTMMTAYVTALGTSSSAATIPVTLEQTIKNNVSPAIAGFVVPLCATIHLSGSTLKIVACALPIMMMTGAPIEPLTIIGFIFMLGITMVAAPGVPGGAIMAASGILQSILGFDQTALGLMIALYMAMDSFGTATNVTGDGAIAVIIDKIARKKEEK